MKLKIAFEFAEKIDAQSKRNFWFDSRILLIIGQTPRILLFVYSIFVP